MWVFDRIDFNEGLRCGDVASEVAFMAMDFDFHGRSDLANLFVREYVRLSGDDELLSLLHFYKCHRAYVRGKIATWAGEREKAEKYFELARSYAL